MYRKPAQRAGELGTHTTRISCANFDVQLYVDCVNIFLTIPEGANFLLLP